MYTNCTWLHIMGALDSVPSLWGGPSAYTSNGWWALSDLKPAARTVLHARNGHSQSWVNVVQLLNHDIIATRAFWYFFNGKQGGFEANQVVISISDVNDHSAVGAAIVLVVQTGEAIGQIGVHS